MYNAGFKEPAIAQYYKISRETVKNIVRPSKQMNSTSNVKIMRRKPKLASIQHVHLLSCISLLRKNPLYATALQYRTPNRAQCSKNAIRKYPHANGIKRYVAAVTPYLSIWHITARLNWSTGREH